MSDVRRALDLISIVASDASEVSVVVHEGEPRSKARPTVLRNGRVITKSSPAEESLAWTLRGSKVPKRRECPIAVVAIFLRSNFQRIDTDNLLKLVLDAGTKAELWLDDSQVTALFGMIELDEERPRTIVALAEHNTLFTRPKEIVVSCARCGKEYYTPYYKTQRRKFCSKACRYEKGEG